MKIYIKVLGCAKNFAEAETLAGRLRRRGAEFVSDPAAADAAIVHTCSFIADAVRESAAGIEKTLARCRRGKTKLIVSGCMPQMYHERLAESSARAVLEQADFLVGTGRLADIPDIVFAQNTRGDAILARPAPFPENFFGQAGGLHDASSRTASSDAPWAYLRVAEGCFHRCNYCLIPRLRGDYISRPAEEIILEARRLAAAGAKEINLVSQDTSAYGRDLGGGRGILGLLRELEKIRAVKWLRLLYCHPSTVGDALIAHIAASRKTVKYLDMPLQHISDNVLRAMGRGFSRVATKKLVEKLRSRIPGLALRTTFIVGHPGETERDFGELLDFVREGHFLWVGIFEYSKMSGTPSALMGKSPPRKVVRARYEKLKSAAAEAGAEALGRCFDKNVEALVVGADIARPYFCAPEADSPVFVKTTGAKAGDFIRISPAALARTFPASGKRP